MTKRAHKTCKLCSFASFCFAEEQNEAQVLLPIKQRHYLKKNAVLCLPHTKFRQFYAIQEGAVKSYHIEADGRELIKGFFLEGEILGYEAIYHEQYHFTAMTLTDSVICEIPYDRFLSLLHSRQDLQKHTLKLLSRQLTRHAYLDAMSAEQRVMGFLMDIAKRLHPLDTQVEFQLPMSRNDIGNYLNLTAETISRTLSSLQKKRLIAINHRKVLLLTDSYF